MPFTRGCVVSSRVSTRTGALAINHRLAQAARAHVMLLPKSVASLLPFTQQPLKACRCYLSLHFLLLLLHLLLLLLHAHFSFRRC